MNNGPIISISAGAGEDLAVYRRIRLNSTTGKAEYADATHDDCIGTVIRPVDYDLPGKDIPSVQCLYSGIHYATASEAITIGELIAPADDGKVKDCSGGETPCGVAMAAASGDGSIIRVVYFAPGGLASSGSTTVLATTNGAITIQNSTVVITKAGVLAATLAVPTTAQNGIEITFLSATANAHTVTTPSAIMHWGDSGGADDVATFAAYAGAGFKVRAYEGTWLVSGLQGVTLA